MVFTMALYGACPRTGFKIIRTIEAISTDRIRRGQLSSLNVSGSVEGTI
jgi:hypothetical protein